MPDEMTTFAQRVTQLHNVGMDADGITDTLYKMYRERPELWPELRKVFRHEVAGVVAQLRRDAEDAAFELHDPVVSRPRRSAQSRGTVNTKAAVERWRNPTMATWLATRVIMPDGLHLSWGEMTAEQHAIRSKDLQQQTDSLLETIRRHEWSRQTILDNHVTCLNDLDFEQPLSN